MLLAMKAGTLAVEKIGKIDRQMIKGNYLRTREAMNEFKNIHRKEKMEKLLKSANQTKKILTIANITLNGVAESMIGAVLTKQLYPAIEFFENKKESIDLKIELLEKTLKDLDSTYRRETNTEKRQEILQAIETYKNNISVQKIVKYQQKR
ncbi:hypothetical protein KC711_07185, partial [Candidatus Peregrinibacteria bacterium]|nr:hypothetical protein [Candidatus Peregrinibacteria bacterium]